MNAGSRLAAWCSALGVEYDDLAQKIGVTRAAVFQWFGLGEESEQTQPTTKNLEKAVKALGLTMAEFYGDIPKRRAS